MSKTHSGFNKSQAAKKALMFGKSAAARAPKAAPMNVPADPAAPAQAGALSPMPMKGGSFGGKTGM